MKKKIIIIEDEKILANLLNKKLISEGYETLMAKDGKEGLEMIRKEMPDLVLLDIVMPEMDGFEVMEVIFKDKELKKIPIIIISNSGQPVELGRAKKLGAVDWLVKAEFDPKEVVDKVKKQLGN
jgi:CheY-like chemotaxis protein